MELSDYDMCLKLVDSAQLACGDSTDSLAYATLCNVAGSAYYELNKLAECRKNWEISAQIQEKLLRENDLKVRLSQNLLFTTLFRVLSSIIDKNTDKFHSDLLLSTTWVSLRKPAVILLKLQNTSSMRSQFAQLPVILIQHFSQTLICAILEFTPPEASGRKLSS
jgi:hypothetical protein